MRNIAEGAALMTETQVSFSDVFNLFRNCTLEDAMSHELEKRGSVAFDDADDTFAGDIQKTLTAENIDTNFKRIGAKPVTDLALCDFIARLGRQP